jgi:hypothetical protein
MDVIDIGRNDLGSVALLRCDVISLRSMVNFQIIELKDKIDTMKSFSDQPEELFETLNDDLEGLERMHLALDQFKGF